MAALDDRIGSQGGRNQVIEAFHELGAGEGLRSEGGGQETVQLLRENSKRVHRVDDRLASPARQGLRNLAMFPERDRQDDCVGLECIPQRLGDDRGSNGPSLRRQRLGRPAARDGHIDVLTGEGVSEGLAYLTESYNCVAHIFSFGLPNPTALRIMEWSSVGRARQICARPPSTASSLAVMKLLSGDARKAAAAPMP